ncbi:MAG: cytochrome c2 [Bacteroidota bacterium]|jgi:mono/diheme cytochrome c family protein|nr:cytochrome c2 [Bacteroidota bacterium]
MDTLFKKSKKQIFAIFSFLFLSLILSTNTFAADGEKIFKQNCAVCHTLGKNKLTGPGLEGIMTRVPSEKWLFDWIKNNKAMIAAGDAYAVKVFNDNNKADMTVFASTLSDEEIQATIDYIKAPPAPTTPAGPVAQTSGEAAPQEEGINPLAVLLGVIAFLIIIIAVLRGVRHSLTNLQNEKMGLPEEEAVGPWTELKNWIYTHKRTTTVIILIITGGLLTSGWYALKGIGVYADPETKAVYHPDQPIQFSHKIHAGDNAINCQYCHSGVEKSKTAGIPSVNVCMNCHKGISSGATTGTKEIAKIYEAAGWDVEKGEYNKPQKPIKWIKVHNLQDFVFFSHQQHVTVGKQDCANCHGDVKEMTTVKQVSPLTMGWCIDCHRKTEVPGMKDNPYYESLHKRLAEKYKGEPITVDKMGGIDCVRCHY